MYLKGVRKMIINVAHEKGGVGKSTIAINLGISLKADILDLDNLNSVVLFNKIRKSKGHTPLNCLTVSSDDEAKEIFKQYRDNKEILVVDSGGYDSTINRLAMIWADFIITPVSPSQVELFGLQTFEGTLRQASLQFETTVQTNVVINNADARSQGDIRKLKLFVRNNKRYLNLMSTVLHHRKDYKTAYAKGVSVIELDKDGKAADEINDLVREIRTYI
jgi:chromosome partitioning protein